MVTVTGTLGSPVVGHLIVVVVTMINMQLRLWIGCGSGRDRFRLKNYSVRFTKRLCFGVTQVLP